MLRLCNLCNGSYKVYDFTSYSASVGPCPQCGPMPEEEWQEYMNKVEARINAADPELKVKGA